MSSWKVAIYIPIHYLRNVHGGNRPLQLQNVDTAHLKIYVIVIELKQTQPIPFPPPAPLTEISIMHPSSTPVLFKD